MRRQALLRGAEYVFFVSWAAAGGDQRQGMDIAPATEQPAAIAAGVRGLLREVPSGASTPMAGPNPQLELQRMSSHGAVDLCTTRSPRAPALGAAPVHGGAGAALGAGAVALLPGIASAQVPAQAIGGTGLTTVVVVGLAALAIAGLIILRTLRSGRKQRPQADPFIIFAPGRDRGSPSTGARMPARPLPTQPLRPPPAPSPAAAVPAAGAARPASVAEEPGQVIEGHTIRFHRLPEGTLRLLPGRLEVIEGADQGHEIRFVQAHPEMDSVTFGRREGSPYEHIQLLVGTVSREHARMQLREGRWWISNLSGTNPVAVNGQAVSSGNGGQQLAEGDRVEMGEVVFRFRER